MSFSGPVSGSPSGEARSAAPTIDPRGRLALNVERTESPAPTEVRNPGAPEVETPEVFLQWKGTDVCLDFRCACGEGGHFDGYFAYHLRCTNCGRVYTMPSTVVLSEVEPDKVANLTCVQEPDIDTHQEFTDG